ncbi:MAG: rRNA maturation RNase YbeY [Planctomycetota bacterium]
MPPENPGTADDADPPSRQTPANDDPLSPGSTQTSAAITAARGRVSCAPTPNRVILELDTDDVDPPAAGWLEPQLERAIDLLPLPRIGDHRITVALLDDDAMADLHLKFTQVPGTTDVLTFDHKDQPGNFTAEGLDADLALGRDVAVREAGNRPHNARTELLLYAVHGLLHLLGYDDHDPAAYEKMHAAEDQLLQQLGFNPVFKSDIASPSQRGGQS